MGWWTREEVKEVVRLVRARSSVDALAERFNRTPRAIKAKIKCVGIYLAASKANVKGSLKTPKKLPRLEEACAIFDTLSVLRLIKIVNKAMKAIEEEIKHIWRARADILEINYDFR